MFDRFAMRTTRAACDPLRYMSFAQLAICAKSAKKCSTLGGNRHLTTTKVVALIMALSEVQTRLLIDFVDAARHIPDAPPEQFCAIENVGVVGLKLTHPGWKHSERRIFEGDIAALRAANLISVSHDSGTKRFYVTQEGHERYKTLAIARGEPTKRIESISLTYLNSTTFQQKYPMAYMKWSEAESLLWTTDPSQHRTTIGHLTREAMQEFASALVKRFSLVSAEPDSAKTVSRIRAVIEALAPRLGATERPFLDALLVYWGTVSDLVQRQEHGALREGTPLLFRDSRRVVLQSAIVMYELDDAISLSDNQPA